MTRFAFPLLFAFALAGCTPSIGDKCVLSTDCSLAGDRQCDTSQPGGYCTVVNCTPNSCPDNAACILFGGSVAGCAYDDRAVARTAHSYCMAACASSGDCRDGYVCADAKGAPWFAIQQDTQQNKTVCLPAPSPAFTEAPPQASPSDPNADPPVCQANPGLDASLPPLPDAGPDVDAGTDAATDAGADADADAGAPDATVD